ncbi:cellulose synthase catalytic subunit (UDP-forming) [Paramecium bursaria Chlorella virus NE-JV-1]|nr:cellulose synthase catalytic subunit (UDP-forming) [Paramecium bursaria Chlorella virus NE-JV-1]
MNNADITVSNRPVVMKKIVKKHQKIAMGFHFFVNLLAYGYFAYFFALAMMQAEVPQIVWLSLFAVSFSTDVLFHLWSISINHNISIVDSSVPVSGLRVAMIATKAPSEPWSVVKTTLEAMMNQDIGSVYDVWIADEKPSDETRAWCAEQGVFVSSREGIDGYHNVDWPRRRKCKEGNLAYFYDTIGYEKYDVVFQFDSDHAPTTSYLKNSLPAFMDPEVDYIAMPNINKKKCSWVSDARQTHEAWYYGPSQMSFSYEHMPMMTGSHYAVRTSALKEIGGLGPELDEDMNTTIMMTSRGKRGVYAGNAIAFGEGPLSFEDAAKQEFQWGKSAIISFVRWRNVLVPKDNKMTASEKFRFFVIRTWYLMQLFFSLYAWLSIATVFFNSWCSEKTCVLSLANLLIYSSPIMIAHVGYNIFIRRNGWLRPNDVPFFSIDLFVYRTLRPIWNAIGIIAGIVEMIFDVVPAFGVTRKGESSTLPLGVFKMWYFNFFCLYYAVFIAAKIAFTDDDVPIMFLIMYTAAAFLHAYIVFKHFNDQKFKAITWANPIGHILLVAIVVGAFVAICVLFSDRIFTKTNADIFIPHFQHDYQMWSIVGLNAGAFLWAIIIAFM